MNKGIEFIIRMVLKEVWARKKLAVSVYVLVAISFALLAAKWPQTFTSSATIIVDDRNIIRPLMEGTAQTTALTEPLKLARSMMSSRTSLKEVLTIGGWINSETSAKEIATLTENIRSRTEIKNQGKNIVKISFRDGDPERAYLATKSMSEIFIRESNLIKQRESESAYVFINTQAEKYRAKLKDADLAIKEFREKNVDSTPGAMRVTNERILTLTRNIEDLDIEILGQKSKLAAQREQLSGGGGAENTASINRENLLRVRISELKVKLEDLRLIYKDTYPDIIQIKTQIATTTDQIKSEIESRSAKKTYRKEELADSPIAQTLRSEILRTQTKTSTLNSRKEQLFLLLKKEREKVNRINAVEAEISELTRESAVNTTKYNQLIAQRESARISKDMDVAQQGINARIQEAAYLPVKSNGVRFLHLIILGFIVSLGAPLVLVFGLALIDQKIRDPQVILEKLQLPVLANVYQIKNKYEKRAELRSQIAVATIVALVWSVYAFEIWLKIQDKL